MTHLKVGVRVRPLSQRELDSKSYSILEAEDDGRTVAVTNIKVPQQNAGDSRERTRRFTFDFCLREDSTQQDVFKAVENVVSEAIKKRTHSCVLAYGQSSSGKTHTMMGFPHDPGLIPRICQEIFPLLEETAAEAEKMQIDVSYLEIYNEKVRDLLHCKEKSVLRVRQHPQKGPYVQGLTSHPAFDSATLLRLLAAGNGNRRVGATLTNPQSSRSHSVLVLNFGGGKVTLVDLAGSERANSRCYTAAARFREGVSINKSLVALGNVISALAEDTKSKGSRRRFIPFRDSVLTWLLKDTLGGNSDTVMIATISPSSECYSETVNTLRFGQRAKLIVSLPVVHEDPKEKIIRELRTEIAKLRELLKQSPMATSLNTNEKLLPMMNFTDSAQKLRRTSSVDQAAKKVELPRRKLSSEESVRRTKGSLTESRPKVEAKVGSIRKTPVKPRSQIVAAVTHRLYAKTKKKEVSTSTSDIPSSTAPKELSICSNARLQLKELTMKALRVKRSKETQTDLFPVLRVKEISTDVEDLEGFKGIDAETITVPLQMQDKEVACNFLDSLHSAFLVTRSCGTQAQPSVSFTKYLENPKVEIYNPHTANPIYTSSVNINISHNYINQKKLSDSVSDDSLEENLCGPTPDLISNHNSLDPATCKPIETKIASVQDTLELKEDLLHFVQEQPQRMLAKVLKVPPHEEKANVNIPSVYAAEVFHQEAFQKCGFFTPDLPEMAMPKIVESKAYSDDVIKIIEPLVLKSVMKNLPESRAGNVEECGKKPRNERMTKAMSGFLEEARLLLTNLNVAASRLQQESEYDVEVTINGMEQKGKKKRRTKDVQSQTDETLTRSHSIQTDLDLTNKYEMLLEDSCRRLEEKICVASEENLWDLVHHEDTSLESNPRTFSDYGSLPRRRKRCTPSLYLKQLASLRRQVVEASREEFGEF